MLQKKLHRKEKKYIDVLMATDVIFPQVHTYNDTKVHLDIYITKGKLNNLKVDKYVSQVLTIPSMPNSFPQPSSSFLPSVGIFLYLLNMHLQRFCLFFNQSFSFFKFDSLLLN